MTRAVGREHEYDFELDGIKCIVPVGENGAKVWSGVPIAREEGETPDVADKKREQESWHQGFGYAHRLIGAGYHYMNAMDARFPRQLIVGPLVTSMTALGTVTGFVLIGTALFAVAGRYLQKVDTTNDDLETPDNTDYTLGVDFTAGVALTSAVPWDSVAVLFLGNSTNARTFTGSAAPTVLSVNSIQGSYGAAFFSEAANDYVFARSYLSSSDPVAAWIATGTALDSTSWGAAYNIGDDSRSITGMAAAKRQAYLGKQDGLYTFDGRSGRAHRQFEAYPIQTNNGTGMIVDSSGRVWYPSAGGLFLYEPNTGQVSDVTPGKYLGNESPVYGRTTSVAQYRGWYYAIQYNGTDSYLVAGRDRQEGEPGHGPILWHGALARFASATAQGLFVNGQTTPPRLYGGSGANAWYVRLPTNGDNALGDSSSRYAASGSTYFSADNFGAPADKHSLTGILFACEGFNTSTYGDVYVKIDGTNWVLLGRLQASGRVMVPVPTGGDWRFNTLAVRIDVTNASSTSTPKIRGISVWAHERLYTRDLIQTKVICSENVYSRRNIPTRKRGRTLLQRLQGLAVKGPVTLKDWTGGKPVTQRVLVRPVPYQMVRYKDRGPNQDRDNDEEHALMADVSMLALASETVQSEAAPTKLKWSGGAKWNGSGAKWG